MYDSYYYDSDYSSSSVSPAETTGILAVLLAYMGMIVMILIGVYILTSIAKMKIFKKAGLPGWKAWVPFYNNWLFLELGGYNGALIFLAFIPFFGGIALLVATCLAANEISKKLDKSDIFILFPLGVITGGITTIIWYCIAGFGKSTWNDSLGKPSLAEGTILGYTTETVYTESAQPAAPTAETPAPEATTEDSNNTNL
jgi:hypothetical protein